MSRVPSLSSPFLLGFDEIERVLDRVTKAADGYPPYNIERVPRDERDPERLRITLAVAGFTREQLDVTTEENQLVIRGRQQDDKTREYLHRGIAARQFQRTFVLADGIEVLGADLKNGLLSIDLARPEPERVIKTISIRDHVGRARGECARDFGAAALAAGERDRGRLAQARDVELVEQLVELLLALLLARLDDFEDGADVVLDTEAAEDRGLLRQVADAKAGTAVHRQAGDVM